MLNIHINYDILGFVAADATTSSSFLHLGKGATMNMGFQKPSDFKAALIDQLLVDIAVQIQLSPTMHDLAVDRYETIWRHIDRVGSPLHGRVKRFYSQGSMAIGATIRTKEDDDLFDIDLIAEIDWPLGVTPKEMLDLLFIAIRGEKGSRYYDMTIRQTRCVTVVYAEMHLDVTPMDRNELWAERGGKIPHAKENTPANAHFLVPANPWGFAKHFSAATPAEDWFAAEVLAKSFGRTVRKADADPVPEHERIYEKSLAVVALQLIKRHVYLVFGKRPETLRRPPSILIAHFAALYAGRTNSLIDELIYQSAKMRIELEGADSRGVKIDVRNPALRDDVLTDRWPETLADQRMFIGDLRRFEAALNNAKDEKNYEKLSSILAMLFGEKAAQVSLERFFKGAGVETKAATSRYSPGGGTALAGLSSATSANSSTVPKHRFYGD